MQPLKVDINARTILREIDTPTQKQTVRTMRRYLKARCRQARKEHP